MSHAPLLSVIVPVYNEEKTISEILRVIDSIKIDKEIIAVDDGSTDRSREILAKLHIPSLKVVLHPVNFGKGAAFRTGLRNASGDIVIIQDADLEYNPNDYPKLIQPILDKRADLVLGARFVKGYKGLFLHQFGNRFLTFVLNMLYGIRLNDINTCYKAAKREIFTLLDLKAKDFSLEQEILIKALKNKLRLLEVPIEYHPRNYSQGKKIRIQDGLRMISKMLELKFERRLNRE